MAGMGPDVHRDPCLRSDAHGQTSLPMPPNATHLSFAAARPYAQLLTRLGTFLYHACDGRIEQAADAMPGVQVRPARSTGGASMPGMRDGLGRGRRSASSPEESDGPQRADRGRRCRLCGPRLFNHRLLPDSSGDRSKGAGDTGDAGGKATTSAAAAAANATTAATTTAETDATGPPDTAPSGTTTYHALIPSGSEQIKRMCLGFCECPAHRPRPRLL